ncbi:hypothetical protein AAHC03_01208 [Spirometra sp. Aus1]
MYEVSRGSESHFGYLNFGSQTADDAGLCDESEVTAQTTTHEHARLLDESDWVACGRRMRKHASRQTRARGVNELILDHSIGSTCSEGGADLGSVELSLQLCDPMRHKRNALKPSLTPGAGTRRTIRRRKPKASDFTIEPRSNNEEAFCQWRDAMRAMARLEDGIPPQFRRRIWLALADHQIVTQRINWPRLVRLVFNGQMNPDDDNLGRQIVKDLHRTGCDEIGSEEDRAALKRVLLAYARWNKRVGYCQGFNILAAVIFNVMERDEEAAFKIMVYLIDYVLPESYFAQNLQALSVDVAVFRELLHLRMPDLANHLSQLQRSAVSEANVSLNLVAGSQRRAYEPPLTNLYAIQWFLTLFATCLPPDCVHRVWDSILLEGSEVGLRAGLVVMAALHDDLLKLTSADQFYSSMSQWMEEFAEGYRLDTVEFMRRVYDIAPLPWTELRQLREKYAFSINPFGEDGAAENYGDDMEEKQQRKVRWWRKARRTEERSIELAGSLPHSPTKSTVSTGDAKTATNGSSGLTSSKPLGGSDPLTHSPKPATDQSRQVVDAERQLTSFLERVGRATATVEADESRIGRGRLSEELLTTPCRSSSEHLRTQRHDPNLRPDLCTEDSAARSAGTKTTLVEDSSNILKPDPGAVNVNRPLPTEPTGLSTGKPSRMKLSQTKDELSELEAAYDRHRMQKMAVDLNVVCPLQIAEAADETGFASYGGLASSVLAPPRPAEKQWPAEWPMQRQPPNESCLPETSQSTTTHVLNSNVHCFSPQLDGHLHNATSDVRQFECVSDSSFKPSSSCSSAMGSSCRLASPPQKSITSSTSAHVTPFHFDESVLEIINEWQLRNAALSPALRSEKETEEIALSVITSASEAEAEESVDGNKQQDSQPRVHSELPAPTTLLSLALRARDSGNHSPETQSKPSPTSAALHSLMVKAIRRDRQRTKEQMHSDPVSPIPLPLSPQPLPSSSSTSPSSEALSSSKDMPLRATSPPPPWAAALASINASRAVVTPSSRIIPKSDSSCSSTSVCPIPVRLSSSRRGFGEKFGLYMSDFAKTPYLSS